ncbi:solute carrier family 35 member G2-like isoform X2 [Branchiostoma floridae]|nr:solute carrier family 35 member G2-like isoform X2 [Branchiostoma floridae]
MSAIIAGTIPSTSRYVQDRGYTPYQIIFFNDLLITLAALGVIIYYRTDIRVSSYKRRAQLFFHGVFRFVGQVFLVMSFLYVPPALAENVTNASIPVFAVIVAGMFLREVPSPVVIFGSICNIIGVILFGYGSFYEELSHTEPHTERAALGFGLAVASAAISACINTNTRSLLQNAIVPKRLLCVCAHGICSVLAGVLASIFSSTWQLDAISSGALIVNVTTHGIFIALLYAGLEFVEVNTQSALRQVTALSAYVLQWAILGLKPTIYEDIGVVCIVAGTLAVVVVGLVGRWKDRNRVSFVAKMGFNDIYDRDVAE